MFIGYIVVAVVLLGVIKLLDRRSPREPLRPAIRRMVAGEDQLTPRARHRFAGLATVFIAIASACWPLFALGVGPRPWTLELALLSSCVAIAGLVWFVASWLGGRKARRT